MSFYFYFIFGFNVEIVSNLQMIEFLSLFIEQIIKTKCISFKTKPFLSFHLFDASLVVFLNYNIFAYTC